MTEFDHKVLIIASFIRPQGVRMLEASASLAYLPAYATEEDTVEAASDVDAILARVATITKPVVRASPKLKIVARHGVGVDSVDVEECTRLGVVVTTTGDANSEAVSEHAFASLLAVARQLTIADADIKAGRWQRDNVVGVELYGKVLGLIGLGRIGSRMAKHSRGFNMNVIACDPYVDPQVADELKVPLVDLETLLRQSDFISLHVPLTEETRNLIGQAEIELMKPSAILVNTARGRVVDESALYEALANHAIAGAALDVFSQEPFPPGHPLTQLDNLVCSPHIAGATEESLIKESVRAADNILRVLRGEKPLFAVNPEVFQNNARVRWKS